MPRHPTDSVKVPAWPFLLALPAVYPIVGGLIFHPVPTLLALAVLAAGVRLILVLRRRGKLPTISQDAKVDLLMAGALAVVVLLVLAIFWHMLTAPSAGELFQDCLTSANRSTTCDRMVDDFFKTDLPRSTQP